ncbi:P-loop NTPase fold protein [Patulibacter sp. SYSU D01012]|uniref:P-loop NTPase fold protein n=1 Tax=Patulibacter sp. SYSU D01012 TaxID=2817381 RepID=UPI001B310A4E|nr:P-loop NTPase fold protein [Patulibacter sp. SYSU D01012]
MSDDLIPDQALRSTDQDAFNHAAIASTLADLVLEGERPLNVALFGRWGSGKSSIYELLRRAVRERDPRKSVELVRYDAWKYGGESLQRNFISFAATSLGFEESVRANRDFHRGLYEKRRGTELSFAADSDTNWAHRLAPLWVFGVVFVALVVLFSALVGSASVLTDENFLGQVAQSLPGFLVSTGGVAVLVAGAKLVADGITTEVEQSQPSAEEQFSKTFDKLVKQAREDRGRDRLVFFIDELDRCSPDDVVATLTGIKTFLGNDNCVFIVAADREVLESALDALPQSAPYDPDAPYYSSASSFFDKIFQHQMPLPPLRGRRLTGFARALVLNRGGLWKDLRAAQEPHRLLDRVMYVLVPSHVRSPRRVKVLLNAYATNVRVAEGRGIEWLEHALELAKLTALQTEFPALAADLQQEPRLPEYLVAAPPGLSPRVTALIRRHGGTHASGAFLDASDSGAAKDAAAAEPTDAPLHSPGAASFGDGDARALARTQHALLRRYLERTADVPSPGRRLLYLEAAGLAVGLEDGALGELIESDAPESPARVVEAMHGRSDKERRQVVRVLADMSEGEFGEERNNVVTALLGVVGLVDGPLGRDGDAALAAIAAYEQERPLAGDQLILALPLALRTEGPAARELVTRLSDDPELLATRTSVARAAALLGMTPDPLTARIHTRVAEALDDGDATPLVDALEILGDDDALELLHGQDVRQSIGARLGEDTEDFAASLIAGVGAKPRTAVCLQRELLMQRFTYDVAFANAATIRPLLTPSGANDHAMLALQHAPQEHWSEWVSYLDPTEPGGVGWAGFPVERMLEMYGAEAAAADAQTTLAALVPFLNAVGEARLTAIVEAATATLTSNVWWTSEDTVQEQVESHGFMRTLVRAPDPELVDAINVVMFRDIERARITAASAGVSANGNAMNGLRLLGSDLRPIDAAALYVAWRDSFDEPEAPTQQLLTLALLRLAAVAIGGGIDLDVSGLTVDRVLALPAEWRNRSDLTPARDWLTLRPPPEDVASLLMASTTNPRGLETVRNYAQRLTSEERTSLAEALYSSEADARWLTVVVGEGADDVALVSLMAKDLRQAGNDPERNAIARYIRALRPLTSAAQRAVAELAIELVGEKKVGRLRTAVSLLEELGTEHRSATALKSTFARAVDEGGPKLKAGDERTLAGINVTLPKKCFERRTSPLGKVRDTVEQKARDLTSRKRPGS